MSEFNREVLGEVSMRTTWSAQCVVTIERPEPWFHLLHLALAPHTFHAPFPNNVSPLLSSESIVTFSLSLPPESDTSTSNAVLGFVPPLVGQSLRTSKR